MTDLTKAKTEVNEIYSYLKESATNMSAPYTKELDDIIKKLKQGIDKYSNSELRDFMMRISVETYTISLVQEQSELKDACAEALQKEEGAKVYALAQGPVEAKKNQVIVDTADRMAVKMLYDAITGILKSRCDEAHRIVSVINGILISRAADAKNTGSPRNEVDQMTLDNENDSNNF